MILTEKTEVQTKSKIAQASGLGQMKANEK
jgi:hypothetical protein